MVDKVCLALPPENAILNDAFHVSSEALKLNDPKQLIRLLLIILIIRFILYSQLIKQFCYFKY